MTWRLFARSPSASPCCILARYLRVAASKPCFRTRKSPKSSLVPPMPTDRFLDVSGLWAGYGATPILQGVSMSVSRGEIVGVIGRNGVGKSTLMRCLIGLLETWRGTITFMDRDVTALQADARARAGFGYIPQGRDVFPQMSVEQNLDTILAIAERCYIMEKGTITRSLTGENVNADNVRAQLLL